MYISNRYYSQKLPYPSKELSLTLMPLTEWILVRLYGKNIVQFLHNQFTCNIKDLNNNQYVFCAYCNAMGKTISNMYVFYINEEEIAFIERINICEAQIKKMKKYSIFSNVTIIPDYQTTLLGIAGKQSRQYLKNFFSKLPDNKNTITYDNDIILLYFHIPIERFLLIIPSFNKNKSDYLFKKTPDYYHIQYHNNTQWIALDIEAGYPWIELKTSELFLPQSIHMDILNGISFKKGCYLGQEIISRVQNHGKHKQKLYQLISIPNTYDESNKLLFPGNYLELKINQYLYRRIGVIIQCCYMINNKIWIQAVLNNPIQKNSQLRIINDTETNNHYQLTCNDCILYKNY